MMKTRLHVVLAGLVVGCSVAVAVAQAPAPTAAELMQRGEAEAKQQHKDLLVEFGASWCGNCKLWDRFLEDPTTGPIMSKHFVVVRLDDGEHKPEKMYLINAGADHLRAEWGGKEKGWPYLVMAKPDAKLIVTSMRPVPGKEADNIGYPALPVEIDWFMEMLKQAAPGMSAQDVATVRAWLKKNSPV